MMTQYPIVALILFLPFYPKHLCFSQNLKTKPSLFFIQGEQRLLKFPEGIKKFSLSGKSTRAKLLHSSHQVPHEIMIKGVKNGVSHLHVLKINDTWEERTIHVSSKSVFQKQESFFRSLSSLETLEIIPLPPKVILRGVIDSEKDLSVLKQIKLLYPDQLIDQTEITMNLQMQLIQKVQQWMSHQKGAYTYHPEAPLLLHASFDQDQERKKVEFALQQQFPWLHVNFETLPGKEDVVHFRVFLLEIKKSTMQKLGFQWSHSTEISAFPFKTFFKASSFFQGDLEALEREGALKILSKPQLSVRVEGEAEFFAGGELPIRNKSKQKSEVLWKNFGLQLKLKLTHSTRKKIRFSIETLMSELNYDLESDGLPSLQTNKIKTDMDAELDTPILLSGLLHTKNRKMISKIPGLSELPVLGALFRSKDYSDETSEFLAILLPSRKLPFPEYSKVQEAPRGPLPLPREPWTEKEQFHLQAEEDYPWNVFQD